MEDLRTGAMLFVLWLCILCIYRNLFTLPIGGVDRLCSVNVALPGIFHDGYRHTVTSNGLRNQERLQYIYYCLIYSKVRKDASGSPQDT